jgi:conjugative transfer region protein TrbK
MEGGMQWVRGVAVVFGLGVVSLLAAGASAQSPSSAPDDALARELQRCKELREGAATDARCQAAYKQSRDQFFAPSKPYEPGAVDMFSKGRSEPWTYDTKPDTGAQSR